MVAKGRFAMRPGLTLREDYDAARLRGVARRTKSAAQGRRLLAVAEIYDGGSRTKAACGVQLARMARRLAVREPLGAMRVEPQHPVPDRLQTDPADAGCLCPRAAVIDLGQCQKTTPLGSALRPPSHPRRRAAS